MNLGFPVQIVVDIFILCFWLSSSIHVFDTCFLNGIVLYLRIMLFDVIKYILWILI